MDSADGGVVPPMAAGVDDRQAADVESKSKARLAKQLVASNIPAKLA
jgi:hypothetical protein